MPTPIYQTTAVSLKRKVPVPKKKMVSVVVETPPPAKPEKGKGRPCLLTSELEAKLLSAIEGGLPLKQSAMLAGVCYETLNRWRKRGEIEGAPPEFRHFCQALQRSEAIAMQRLVSQVSKAGNTDWRAAAWILERRHPNEFGKIERVESRGDSAWPKSMSESEGGMELMKRFQSQDEFKSIFQKLMQTLQEVKMQRTENENWQSR